MGSVMVTVVPTPTSLSAEIWPPWASTNCRAMASPRPLPEPPSRVRDRVAAPEAVEDVGQILGRDSRACVADGYVQDVDLTGLSDLSGLAQRA